MGKVSLVRDFSRTFWLANVMELFEGAAYYGLNSVLAVYLTGSVASGGLGFGEQAVGFLRGIVYAATYVLPIPGEGVSRSTAPPGRSFRITDPVPGCSPVVPNGCPKTVNRQ